MQRQKGRPDSMCSLLAKIQQEQDKSVSGPGPADTSTQSTSISSVDASRISVDASLSSFTSSMSLAENTKQDMKDPDYASGVKDKATPKKKNCWTNESLAFYTNVA